jgi:hypothetical protein
LFHPSTPFELDQLIRQADTVTGAEHGVRPYLWIAEPKLA